MTPNQKKLLDYLKSYYAEHEIMPKYEEMMNALGYKSKSRIHDLLTGLEERNKIVRVKHRQRAIFIVHKECPYCGGRL